MKRDKTDALFSRYIKLLSGGFCKRCGNYLGVKSRGLHCAHLFSRGKLTTRFVRDNAHALCYGCHRYVDQHPLVKQEFFRDLLGNEKYNELYKLSNKTTKDHPIDISVIEVDLKSKIKILER